ncbi:MAG TPA: potassium channel family protein [Candidatus Limnocylindria bacterium]|nr:potassium channel family protein [Candidatus Limnocylindria bacterium]
MIDAIELALGLALLVWILSDVFESVVVPRPTPGFRPTTILIRLTWPGWRAIGLRRAPGEREHFLGQYASLLLVTVLMVWIAGLIVSYGLVFAGLHGELRPEPPDLFTAIYFAATSLLTIGFGDIVALGASARFIAIVSAATGLGVVALAISFLFSLFASFQRRESLVVTLDQRAGAPPSGVQLLETMALKRMRDALGPMFGEWERWAAEVLDSHVSYPILAYFRSTHDNESWVSAIGAMLDAATLVVTTIEDGPYGPAHMLVKAGDHLVEDLTSFFRLPHGHECGVEREEFDAARERLSAVGYHLRPADDSWRAFSDTRATYASDLNELARYWAVPPALWVGDRSYVPHSVHAVAR